MPQPGTVYLDLFLLINLVMDYLILWVTAHFGQLDTSAKRLFLGALAGSLYSLALFWPQASWMFNTLFRVVLSLAMILLAFGYKSSGRFVQAIFYFYLVAFALGGAVLGSMNLLAENEASLIAVTAMFSTPGAIPYAWLGAGALMALVVARWGVVLIKRNVINSMMHVPIILHFGDVRLAATALVDTGNQLTDPLTAMPVLVVEYDVLKPVMPQEIRLAFEENPEPDLLNLLDDLAESLWATRVRLIPYTTIGKNKGMLLGVRPDDVVIITKERWIKVQNVILAVYSRSLTSRGEYQALLNPDLLQAV